VDSWEIEEGEFVQENLSGEIANRKLAGLIDAN